MSGGLMQEVPGRRAVMAGLVGVSWLALGVVAARVLGVPHWTVARGVVWVGVMAGAPWTLLTFWNAVVGFGLMMAGRGDPAVRVNPALRVAGCGAPCPAAAVAIAVRHEDPARVMARVRAMRADLRAAGALEGFRFHVISDSDAGHEAAERAAVVAEPGVHYRRRTENVGFKAGNLQDFARSMLDQADIMIVLDADSVMSAAALVRMVRVMRGNPELGILQSVPVGRPAGSAFTRAFQFGMRHGMRSHTLGAAWWQGSSGPFWGHNAAVRVRPFVDHAGLPVLPGGRAILSHDQVEAALMRAAGLAVRVDATDGGSWEENPPNLVDFIGRNLRWCQGNMQYVHLVARPGFRAMGRFQLANAILMYAAPVAWTVMLLAALAGSGWDPAPARLIGGAFGFYLVMMGLGFLPRLFGVAAALVREPGRWGGRRRLVAGCVADGVATLLMAPVTMVAEAVFVAGLMVGRRIGWGVQARDDRRVTVVEAARMLWPQTVLGVVGFVVAPGAVVAWPVLGAWVLAVPFAWGSALPCVGAWMRRVGLCAVPDEIVVPGVLGRL